MADFHLRTFPYAGLAVPSESPFFPVIMNVGGERKVKFNQGYVLDYQSLDKGGVKAHKVVMETSYGVSVEEGPQKYYVEIKTSADKASVTSAEIKPLSASEEIEEKPNFHYGVTNAAKEESYVGEGIFNIPLCSIDANGSITEIYLRENIHWQKINFENKVKGGNDAVAIGVLHDWGDSAETFGDNPKVQFKSIVQLGAVPNPAVEGQNLSEGEQFIKIQESAEGNIVVTTQLPAMPKDKPLVLVRDKTNVWKWIEFSDEHIGPSILYYDKYTEEGFAALPLTAGILFVGEQDENQVVFGQIPYPDAEQAAANPFFLAYDGTLPYWAPSEPCEEDPPP